MSRWLLAVVAVAGAGCGTVPFPTPTGMSADDAPPPDGGTTIDPQQCELDFTAAVSNVCGSTTDCMLLPHVNCCGTIVLGVKADNKAFFAEDTYEACEHDACMSTPSCKHPDEAEDGTPLSTGQSAVLECIMNQCTSTGG